MYALITPTRANQSRSGILPHDGRNISFRELNTLVRKTYNFSPSFCFFVPNHAAELLNKSYWKDKFDLEELNLHNGIEHDASLTRTFLFLFCLFFCFRIAGLVIG